VAVRDGETGRELELRGKIVVNATGVFADDLRRVDDPDAGSVIRPSQGVHLVLGRHFLPEDSAIMVPRTEDGRVLFAIPWYHCVIVGTTDTPVDRVSLEPVALDEEVDFILRHAARYLTRDPTPDDVLSVFAGLRPLVGSPDSEDTSHLSREHAVLISRSGLLTIAGGKWTTYRKMAEDVMDHAIVIGGLDPQPCVTKELRIHGFHLHADRFGELAHYGSDAPEIQRLLDSDPGLGERIHPRLPARRGEVAWAVREEMCRTVDDFLARRTRSLLFDARAAVEAAPDVAALMAEELGVDEEWQDAQVSAFKEIARGYVVG
ncbi:MAG: FAD-dependent oxidoreductase, partial [Gemmatimonadetes bacterium]|nr:FAD-dependent oxidoreductase [Gemmatimonadota bacterium]